MFKAGSFNLMETIKANLRWSFAGFFFQKVVTFGTALVLSHMLTPADFGVYAFAFVVLDGASFIKSFGLDAALINKKDLTQDFVDSIFTFFLISGSLLSFAIFLLASPITTHFNKPNLYFVLVGLAPTILLGSINRLQTALLEKNLKFDKRTLAELISLPILPVVCIFLASHGYGVKSLVFGYLSRQVGHTICIFYLSDYRPRLSFSMEHLREASKYGKFVAGSSLIEYLRADIDIAIVGVVLGMKALGQYSITLSLSTLVGQTMVLLVSRVYFPLYSRLGSVSEESLSLLRSSYRIVGVLAFPVAVILFFSGKEILGTFYGQNWVSAASILKYVAIFGLIKAVLDNLLSFFRGVGKPEFEFRIKIIQFFTLFFILYPLLTNFHLNGAGIALLLSMVPIAFISYYFLKTMEVAPMMIFKTLLPNFIASFGFGALLWVWEKRHHLMTLPQSFLDKFYVLLPLFGLTILYFLVLFLMERYPGKMRTT